VTSFYQKSPTSGCRRLKNWHLWCIWLPRRLKLAGWGSHGTENDVTSQVIGSDPEVTSLDRKSPKSGCRRPKTRENSRLWRICLLTRQEVTRKWRHFTGSHLEVAVESRKQASLMRLIFYKALAGRKRQSGDRKWHHVTSGDRKWPKSNVISPEITWKWL